MVLQQQGRYAEAEKERVAAWRWGSESARRRHATRCSVMRLGAAEGIREAIVRGGQRPSGSRPDLPMRTTSAGECCTSETGYDEAAAAVGRRSG